METKKILFILFMLLSSIGIISAQDKWSIGPRGGVNFSNVTNVDDSKSITGGVIGLTTTYSINENSGLTLDALYSVEGWEDRFGENHLHYLQVPLYYDFFFGELGNAFRPKVYLGVAPGFYLGNGNDDIETGDDYYRKMVLSATGGLGFNLRVASRIWLNTDLRSYIGLSDLRSSDFDEGDKVKSRNVQLSLGLCYGISKLD